MAKTEARPFGKLFQDRGGNPIQTGNSFQTADATGTPQNSPLAYSSSVITIAVPDSAIEIILNPTTALRVSEVVGMGTYDIIAANTKEVLPCAGMASVYIKRDAADGTVNFRFSLV